MISKTLTKTNQSLTETVEQKNRVIFGKFISDIYLGIESTEAREEFYKNILPKITDDKIPTDKEARNAYLIKTAIRFGLDTMVPLVESVSSRYWPLAIDFFQQLIAEYDCRTASEKALAQIIVNAYIRIMEYSNTLEGYRRVKIIDGKVTGHYSIISKELDRANRHFTSALMTLKQLKAPMPKIKVNAKNAFVAENQQLNINQNNNENIKPK